MFGGKNEIWKNKARQEGLFKRKDDWNLPSTKSSILLNDPKLTGLLWKFGKKMDI